MTRILFVELLGGVGDLVIALPAIHALALSHPQAEVSVLTFEPGADLVRADPLIHRVYTAERGDRSDPERPRRALKRLLESDRFDVIVADATYAEMGRLIEATGARAVTNLWRKPPPDQLIEERFLQILSEEGLVEPWTLGVRARLAVEAGDRLWAAANLPGGRWALLHPHAGMPIKVWPPERFVALGRALQARHGLGVVVPEGVGAEGEVARKIVSELAPASFLLPSGSLRQFAAAAAYADVVVGADSGPVRVAAATGVLTITLFGPSWHGRYGHRPPHVNLQGYPECPVRVKEDFTRQPCWYTGRCPLGWWRTCLEAIRVQDVLEAADSLLAMTAWWGKPLAARMP
ncbi:MAG: glycosyltransferase family 9 protein [Anaerolineae bacterium]|nr:glycosyltransferase family 9 protein [Anaerolineae bacterium]